MLLIRTGGQIGNNDSADDVRNVDLTKIHYLTGPFDIEGAEPGDILLVEIMDVQPFQVSKLFIRYCLAVSVLLTYDIISGPALGLHRCV